MPTSLDAVTGSRESRQPSSDVQPAIFLEEMEKVIAIGSLAGDDLFLSLIIGDRESNLHRLIGRILFGKVNQFYV